jgi:hypothetical protein
MKSITIHKLDDLLAEKIEALAKENGASLNTTIKLLLRRSLQIETGPDASSKSGYRQFLGKWNESEANEFDAAVEDFSTIDETDWIA